MSYEERLREMAGLVLMVGIPGPEIDRETEAFLSDLNPGGVILFSRNMETLQRFASLRTDLDRLLPGPRLFAIDQEGGRVNRLKPWIGETPAASEIAAKGDRSAFRIGRATALLLRSLGINIDFAPVVDLCDPEATNGIGDRSFGRDPSAVAVSAGSFLDGLQREGVAGCLKHFPGLGDTSIDSHKNLPTCGRDRRQLEEEDLLPFRTLCACTASVMVGHGHYPALDPGPGVPASLSARIVDGVLRSGLGYRGLVISDDLEMGAVRGMDRNGRAAVTAIGAGCDMVLYCGRPDAALTARQALVDDAGRDQAFDERLQAAARSVVRTASRWPSSRVDQPAWEHALTELRASIAPRAR